MLIVLSRINKSAKCTVRITVTSLWGQASLDGGRGSPPPRTAPSFSINVTHTQSPLRLKEPASRFPIHVLHATRKYDSRPLKWVPAVAESGGSLGSDKPPRASPSLYATAVHKANLRKHCLPSFRVPHYNITSFWECSIPRPLKGALTCRTSLGISDPWIPDNPPL